MILILGFLKVVFNLVMIVLTIEFLRLGLIELKRMFKGFRFDLESIGFGLCFIGMIVLYCLYS